MRKTIFNEVGSLASAFCRRQSFHATEACLLHRQCSTSLSKQASLYNALNNSLYKHSVKCFSTSCITSFNATRVFAEKAAKTAVKSKSLAVKLSCPISIATLAFVTYGVWFAFKEIAYELLELKEVNEYCILVASAALTYSVYNLIKGRYTINPKAVHYQAIRKLEKHPGVREVMGKSLVGHETRICLTTDGGLFMNPKLVPKWRNPRIQMMFPVQGPEREGIVSLEAKRVKGRYLWKLLAVDVRGGVPAAISPVPAASTSSPAPGALPPASSPDLPEGQRIYVIGDREAYLSGAVISEVRDPFLKALDRAAVVGYEEEDFQEAEIAEIAATRKQVEEDARRRAEADAKEEQQKAERKAQEEEEEVQKKVEKENKKEEVVKKVEKENKKEEVEKKEEKGEGK